VNGTRDGCFELVMQSVIASGICKSSLADFSFEEVGFGGRKRTDMNQISSWIFLRSHA